MGSEKNEEEKIMFTTIKVSDFNGDTVEVNAIRISPYIAVHKSVNGKNAWVVTHIQSGLSCGANSIIQDVALGRAEYISQYGNFQNFNEDDEVYMGKLKEVISQAIMEFSFDQALLFQTTDELNDEFLSDADFCSDHFCGDGIQQAYYNICEAIWKALFQKFDRQKANELISVISENIHEPLQDAIYSMEYAVNLKCEDMCSLDHLDELVNERVEEIKRATINDVNNP